LSENRYHVTCTHATGIEEDCGVTMPSESLEESRSQVLEWIAGQVQPQDQLLMNDRPEALS